MSKPKTGYVLVDKNLRSVILIFEKLVFRNKTFIEILLLSLIKIIVSVAQEDTEYCLHKNFSLNSDLEKAK